MSKFHYVVLILLLVFTVVTGCRSGNGDDPGIGDFEIRDISYEKYSNIYTIVRGTIQNISENNYDYIIVYARAFTEEGLILDTRYDYIGDLLAGEESIFEMYIMDNEQPILDWEIWVDTTY